jgi:hypothetical protein
MRNRRAPKGVPGYDVAELHRDSVSLAALYRRRARKRTALIDLAQTWLRLAQEQEASVPSEQPVAQQQQQIQPRDDDENGLGT